MRVEAQLPGEDEVAAAFQLLVADGLYAQALFLNFLIAQGKQVLWVLNDERRDLYQDVLGLMPRVTPQKGQHRSRDCLCWDVPDPTAWPQVRVALRVVRSQESYALLRQASWGVSEERAEWMWATTLSATQASTELVERLGPARWDIENYSFNELVNDWHADHAYKHHPNAIEAFTLLAYDLFHALLTRNVKPQLREGKTESFWAHLIAAQIYAQAGTLATARSP